MSGDFCFRFLWPRDALVHGGYHLEIQLRDCESEMQRYRTDPHPTTCLYKCNGGFTSAQSSNETRLVLWSVEDAVLSFALPCLSERYAEEPGVVPGRSSPGRFFGRRWLIKPWTALA